MSELIVNSKEGIKQIKEIQFGVFSPSEIAKISTIECINTHFYAENSDIPIPYSPVDPRLGVNKKKQKCPTCNKKLEECPGHFGYVRLNFPIFHIGFFKKIIEILRCICKNCSRILLPEEEKYKLRITASKMKKLSVSRKKNLLGEISKLCSKVKICPYCGALNGKVKHIQGIIGPTIIVHELNKKDIENEEEKNPEKRTFKRKYESAMILLSQKNKSKFSKESNIDYPNNIFNNSSSSTVTIELTSPFVYNLLSHISPEDIIFFGMDEENSSPINLLLQYVIVPPLPIRPTVSVSIDKINEDDLTLKIRQMIHINKYLKSYIIEGNGNTYKLMDDLNLLQSVHAYYINSNTKGINKNILGDNKEIRSFCTRLKGKTGRFRGNLSGKRTDFTGRTVISPDPNLQIDQLGIPVLMAMNLTYPERVNKYNIKKLKKFIMNGNDKHPGANFIFTNNGENKIYLGYVNREKICNELKIGDIVERHIIDDDIVLFNRQPSLHRVSIMSFKAKILPWRTLRFNESCCTPFNADFDGDEMNIHVPQTEEARAEAYHLMGVTRNFQSPKLGEPLIASIQDFLITCYLITQKDYFLDRSHFIRYCTYFNDGKEKVEIPFPAIMKPKELWTGKQLFSVILRPNKNYKNIINLKNQSNSYNKNYVEFDCPNDGFVIIKNSELICGIIDKQTLGKESKDGLVFTLIKDCGFTETAKFLTRISKFSSRWICDYGLSFGIGDVIPSKYLIENKTKVIRKAINESEKQINLYNSGKIEIKPGLNEEESLETYLNKIFSDTRDTLGNYLVEVLPRTNSALQMTVSGSKGSRINLSQMICCVGQQTVSDNRIPYGFANRTLPHFEEFSKYATSKGFVGHSYYNGLNAIEFFFHSITGREGIIDTSTKTSRTGYMQRRLVKFLEDVTVQYNNTVTISSGEIIQFLYGDDGIEPSNTDSKNKIVYIPRLWDFICTKYPIKETNDKVLEVNEITEKVEEYISKCPISKYELNREFIKEIRQFFLEKINVIELAKKSFGNKKSNIINKICAIGYNQLKEFFNELWTRYIKAKVNPGEVVGAVAGQSIGEPGTQMTLKTFHFAGVSSMNITLGIPRIEEIVNNTQNITTPIITGELVKEDDLSFAKKVKGRIEKIKLKRICKYIKEVLSPEGCYIKIKLNEGYIKSSNLDISIQKVKEALLLNKKKLSMKLKENHMEIEKNINLKIKFPEVDKNSLYFTLEIFMKNLPEIIISGISTVNRAIINIKEEDGDNKNNKKYNLIIEGTGFLDVMKTEGIDHKHCKSNHIGETLNTLGIEAARKTIIDQLDYTYRYHSIKVDKRHLGLIADLMTFKGNVHGFQRFGILKTKDSVFLNSSFERTTDILFDAAIYGKMEFLKGVSESIIVGKTANIGTGTFKLFMDKKMFDEELKEKKNEMVVEEENINVNNDGKDFAKNKVQFNMYDMIS